MMNPVEFRKLKEWAPLPLILMVVMYIAPGFLIDPHLDNLAATESSFDTLLHSAQEAIGQRAQDQRTSKREDLLQVELARLERWLPPERNLPVLIDQFNYLAGLLGIGLSSVQYKFPDPGRGDYLPGVFILFQLDAGYQAMRVFLQALESLPWPLVVTEILATRNGAYSIAVKHLVKP